MNRYDGKSNSALIGTLTDLRREREETADELAELEDRVYEKENELHAIDRVIAEVENLLGVGGCDPPPSGTARPDNDLHSGRGSFLGVKTMAKTGTTVTIRRGRKVTTVTMKGSWEPCVDCGGMFLHKPHCTTRAGDGEKEGMMAGHCVDINGDSWHRDGDVCGRCGFGIEEHPEIRDGKGQWGEPLTGRRGNVAEDLEFAWRHTE